MKHTCIGLLFVLIVALVGGVPPAQVTPAHVLADAEPATSGRSSGGDPRQAIDDFVANAGGPVGAEEIVSFLNSDAETAAQSDYPFGAPAVFNPSATYLHIAAARLTDSKFVVVYTDVGYSQRGTAVVGQVSGTDITYGAEYVFNAALTSYESVAALSATKFVVAYLDEDALRGEAIVGQVTGTAISYGAEAVFNTADTRYVSVAALSEDKFVVAYSDVTPIYIGTAIEGFVTGTTISYGTAQIFSWVNTDYVSVAALSEDKFVVAYQDSFNSGYGTAIVGEIGVGISWGSGYVFNSANTQYVSVAALTDSKFVVAYNDGGNSGYGTAIVGEVAGTGIAYGAEYVFNAASTLLYHSGGVAPLSGTAFVVGYENVGDSDGRVIVGAVSGNSIVFGNQVSYNAGSASYDVTVVALSESQYVVAWDDESNSDYGTAKVGSLPAFGSAAVFNPVVTADIAAAKLANAKFVVAYQDLGNSDGRAIVGQVSGTGITYGAEYVFNAASTSYVSVAALSDTKFVIAYRDGGNSNYGTAVVGQVTGTAISWGGEYFVADPAADVSVAALSDTKFVMAYSDGGNASHGTAVVGQVTGTTIGYGSPAVFNSATTLFVSVAALTDAKFVVAYSDWGNSDCGTAVVGQVSGTGIAYGAEYVFNAVTWETSVVALSAAKFVVVYRDFDNSQYGTAIVGQASGTTISYGSEAVFNAATTTLFHSSGVARLSDTLFVVGYEDAADDDGQVIVGGVSDSTITFGHQVSYNVGARSQDVTVAALSPWKFIVAWDDEDNSDRGTAKVGTLPTSKVYLPLVVRNYP